MPIENQSEHAPFSSTTPTTIMSPTPNPWIMDEKTRNALLKKYKIQVASAASTVCATLAMVGPPFDNA